MQQTFGFLLSSDCVCLYLSVNNDFLAGLPHFFQVAWGVLGRLNADAMLVSYFVHFLSALCFFILTQRALGISISLVLLWTSSPLSDVSCIKLTPFSSSSLATDVLEPPNKIIMQLSLLDQWPVVNPAKMASCFKTLKLAPLSYFTFRLTNLKTGAVISHRTVELK